MIVKQTAQFKKIYKRLGKARLALINQAIGEICASPAAGEKGSGDLSGLLFYKFKARKTVYLLAYERKAGRITLISAASVHDDFYGKIKNPSLIKEFQPANEA
jgi:hypothetical protein